MIKIVTSLKWYSLQIPKQQKTIKILLKKNKIKNASLTYNLKHFLKILKLYFNQINLVFAILKFRSTMWSTFKIFYFEKFHIL